MSDIGFIRCYHYGKIFPCDDFSKGIYPGKFEFIKKRAEYLFFDGINDKTINQIILNNNYSDKGKLFFCYTKKSLNNMVNYILQGSEALYFIAQDIEKILPNINLKRKLFNSGKPVVFHINIPIQDFMKKNIEILYREINSNGFDYISKNDDYDCGPYITKPINSCNIIKKEELSITYLFYIASKIGYEIP